MIPVPQPTAKATIRRRSQHGPANHAPVVTHGGWLAVGVYLQQPNGTLGPEATFSTPYASWSDSTSVAAVTSAGTGRRCTVK